MLCGEVLRPPARPPAHSYPLPLALACRRPAWRCSAPACLPAPFCAACPAPRAPAALLPPPASSRRPRPLMCLLQGPAAAARAPCCACWCACTTAMRAKVRASPVGVGWPACAGVCAWISRKFSPLSASRAGWLRCARAVTPTEPPAPPPPLFSAAQWAGCAPAAPSQPARCGGSCAAGERGSPRCRIGGDGPCACVGACTRPGPPPAHGPLVSRDALRSVVPPHLPLTFTPHPLKQDAVLCKPLNLFFLFLLFFFSRSSANPALQITTT